MSAARTAPENCLSLTAGARASSALHDVCRKKQRGLAAADHERGSGVGRSAAAARYKRGGDNPVRGQRKMVRQLGSQLARPRGNSSCKATGRRGGEAKKALSLTSARPNYYSYNKGDKLEIQL